jgi:hypothetical protein
MSDTMTMTTAAISPTIKNVLSVEVIQPMAVNASQMARITPRIVHIIRPMHPVCAQRAAQAPLRSDRVASAVGGRSYPPAAAAPGAVCHRDQLPFGPLAVSDSSSGVSRPLVTVASEIRPV